MRTIESIATPDPVTVAPTASIRFVIELLLDAEIRHVPVTRQGELVGIVSDRDVRAWQQAWQDLDELDGDDLAEALLSQPISQLMSSPVETCAPDDSIAEVAARLADEKISAIVLVDEDEIVGIATVSDILRALAAREGELLGV